MLRELRNAMENVVPSDHGYADPRDASAACGPRAANACTATLGQTVIGNEMGFPIDGRHGPVACEHALDNDTDLKARFVAEFPEKYAFRETHKPVGEGEFWFCLECGEVAWLAFDSIPFRETEADDGALH
jgi:hypothetical protein